MKRNMKLRFETGALRRARNAMAKSLASPLFRNRMVKSKKVYTRKVKFKV